MRPYEPGKPASALRRELGLEQVVKLASNEGPYGPFPAALDAIAAAAPGLNRYPEGATELLEALSARHGLGPERIAAGNGADGVIANVALAYLQPGDEVLMGWPSFVSYRLSSLKLGATPVTVPLRDGAYDLDAMAGSVTERTRVAYVCSPNNPTGNIVAANELAAFLDAVPERVLVVIDAAYHEYVTRTARMSPSCARSRRSTGWPVCGSATPSPSRASLQSWARCAGRSTYPSSPMPPRWPAWAARTSWPGGASRTSGTVSGWPRACAPTVSTRSRPPATSSAPTSATAPPWRPGWNGRA